MDRSRIELSYVVDAALRPPTAIIGTASRDYWFLVTASSRSIIEAHHGRLWAEPKDGPGAAFCFSLPVATQGTTEAVPVTTSS